MNKQITLSALTDELAQARTRKKEFLEQMDRIIPWSEWIGIIKPHYYKGERGNKPYELETMLRIHVLQELYDLADMAVMNEVIDSRAFSRFCGVDSSNQVPDGDTIGRFRALLVEHGLQEKLFAQVVALFEAKGLILKKGSIVDSSIIAASSSTKNREKKRDRDAHQTKKGNTWYFGYKAHIGVDKTSGLVHHVPGSLRDYKPGSSGPYSSLCFCTYLSGAITRCCHSYISSFLLSSLKRQTPEALAHIDQETIDVAGHGGARFGLVRRLYGLENFIVDGVNILVNNHPLFVRTVQSPLFKRA